jgi:hypothetical protein
MNRKSLGILFVTLLFFIASAVAAQNKEQEAAAIAALVNTKNDFKVEIKPLDKKPGQNDPFPTLTVESLPSGASVYINFSYAGTTPLTLKDVNPGGYRIALQKERYKSASTYINLDTGKLFHLSAILRELTGYISIKVEPEDAQVYAGGNQVFRRFEEIPIGDYEIRIRRFGYRDYLSRATILENATTTIEAVLAPAEFAVSDFFFSRKTFNPENPGLLGSTDISFKVAAYGKGVLRVYDESGMEVYTHTFPDFTTWDQSVRWNGRGNNWEFLPDGNYSAKVSAVARDGGKEERLEAPLRIDRSLIIRYRNLWSGLSGLMYAPTSTVLPPGSFQISSTILGLTAVPEVSYFESLYFAQAGSTIGILPRLEITPLLSLSIRGGDEPPDITASVGLKYRFHNGRGRVPLSFSAVLRGTGSTEPSYAGFSQFPGLAAGAVMEARFGLFGLLAAQEINFSPLPITNDPEASKDTDLHVWGLGRIGIFFDSGNLLMGFSTAFATRSFREKIGLQLPVHMGYELHWLLPGSLFYLSGMASWEYHPKGPDRIFLGGGLGVIY